MQVVWAGQLVAVTKHWTCLRWCESIWTVSRVLEAYWIHLIQASGRCRYKMKVPDGECRALIQLHFKYNNRKAVAAARGEHKHEKGCCKYQSEASFVEGRVEVHTCALPCFWMQMTVLERACIYRGSRSPKLGQVPVYAALEHY